MFLATNPYKTLKNLENSILKKLNQSPQKKQHLENGPGKFEHKKIESVK